MGTDRVNERGWVCAGCGYALDGLDPDAACTECGGWTRRDTRVRSVRRAWGPRAATSLALGPSALLIALVMAGPGLRGLAAFYRWCGDGLEAMLLLGPVAVLHGVAVGAAALDGGELGLRRRIRMADGVIFLAPIVVVVDLAVFALPGLLVTGLRT